MRNSKRHRDLNYGVPIFQERMIWPIWLWLFLIFITGSIVLSIWAALGNIATIFAGVLLSLGLMYAARASALWITVTKGWLLVGPAAIERAFIHNFQELDTNQFRSLRGVNANPAAYLELRFWVSRGLKIELRDPKDKTPYWLISTNRAKELSKTLNLAAH
jgi:hypothetical protein